MPKVTRSSAASLSSDPRLCRVLSHRHGRWCGPLPHLPTVAYLPATTRNSSARRWRRKQSRRNNRQLLRMSCRLFHQSARSRPASETHWTGSVLNQDTTRGLRGPYSSFSTYFLTRRNMEKKLG